MPRLLLFVATLIVCTAAARAQPTAPGEYRIEVEIEDYESDILTLGYYLLDNQYIIDTAQRADDGRFVFASDTAALPQGVYLIVLSPTNDYFQLVIGEKDQNFAIRTSMENLAKPTAVGSRENELFYDYLAYLDSMQRLSQDHRQLVNDTTTAPALRAQSQTALEEMDARVRAYQQRLLDDHPEAFVSAIVRANRPATPPDFAEMDDEDARRELQWRWLQQHYFDGLDISDPRLLRTPFLFDRIDYFVNQLQVPHPDSLAEAIDQVLARLDPGSEAFKYYTVHYTNEAATSNVVGMDALYVHMVDNYYLNGRAYWADEEQLRKMQDNTDRLRPLLIGKTAPDLNMETRDGSPVSLHETEAEYTILYFWRYDCPACKKSTPQMKEVYAKWKERGVEFFSVCTKAGDELGECWEYIDEHEIGEWVQAVDPYQRYYRDYDIRSTPAIFVLDKDKTIVSKRIGADQLDDVLMSLERQAAGNGAGS